MDCGNETIKVCEAMVKKAGVPFEGKVVEGHPATKIIKRAEDAKMDVICGKAYAIRDRRNSGHPAD